MPDGDYRPEGAYLAVRDALDGGDDLTLGGGVASAADGTVRTPSS